MPIPKKWSKMERQKIVATAPNAGGLYELTSFGEQRALYIGRSSDLKHRLLEHLADTNPNRFRFKTASLFQSPRSMEKQAFDAYENKYSETPPWNDQDPRSGWL